MAKYKLVPELDGIEIYFDEKPSADIRSKLVANRWRWNGAKGCWYTKQSQQAEKLAKELCGKASSEFISKPTPPIKSVGNSVSFEQKSNTFTTNVSIKKEGNTYTWSSTNNQIACADCNRFFSIHAPACIFCGCPIIHTIETHYNKQIARKAQDIQKQAEEREEKRKKEEKEYKKKAIEIFNKQYNICLLGYHDRILLGLSIEKFKKIEEHAQYLHKNKNSFSCLTTSEWFRIVQLDDDKFQKEINSIQEIRQKTIEEHRVKEERKRRKHEEYWAFCSNLEIPGETIAILEKKGVPLSEVANRIDTIDYYATKYPYLNLGHGGHVLLTSTEFSNYIKQRVKK